LRPNPDIWPQAIASPGLRRPASAEEVPVAASLPEEAGLRDEHESELLRRELERRLAWMSDSDGTEFGSFTRLDWWISGVCFFLLPLVLVWWVA
jgi:hypothetical protein